MTPDGVVTLVSKLYAAAGRVPGEVDFEVYEEALEGVANGLALQAQRELLRLPNLRPSPGLVLDQVESIRRRSASAVPAVGESSLATADHVRAGAAEARRLLARTPQRLSVSLGQVAHRISSDAHAFGDHDQCGPDCSERVGEHAPGAEG